MFIARYRVASMYLNQHQQLINILIIRDLAVAENSAPMNTPNGLKLLLLRDADVALQSTIQYLVLYRIVDNANFDRKFAQALVRSNDTYAGIYA